MTAVDVQRTVAVGDEVDRATDHDDAAVLAGDGAGGHVGVLRVGQAVDPARRSDRAGQRQHLPRIGTHDGRAQTQQVVDELTPVTRGTHRHRVQHPGRAVGPCLRRGQPHAVGPARRRRPDVHVDSVGERGQLGGLLRIVHHGGRRAHRGQHVGRQVHRDEVGEALHQRCSLT